MMGEEASSAGGARSAAAAAHADSVSLAARKAAWKAVDTLATEEEVLGRKAQLPRRATKSEQDERGLEVARATVAAWAAVRQALKAGRVEAVMLQAARAVRVARAKLKAIVAPTACGW